MRAHAALRAAKLSQASINPLTKSSPASRVFRPLPAPRVPSRTSKFACRVEAAQAGVPGDGSLPPPPQKDPLPSVPANFVAGVVKAYNDALTKHPVATKALTSLIGFAIGDRIAQTFGGGPFDVYRFLRLSLYGFLIDGPIGHYFYQFLDTRIRPDDPKGTQVGTATIVPTAPCPQFPSVHPNFLHLTHPNFLQFTFRPCSRRPPLIS
jgi:hypothetical protein